MKRVDQQAQERWRELCSMMAGHLRNMGAAERHELMQIQMSKARRPAENLLALCRMSAMLIHTQRRQVLKEATSEQ